MIHETNMKVFCRCLSDDMYTELTRTEISYREITFIYGKTHVIVV